MKKLIIACLLALLPAQAFAASGATTINVEDAGATSRTVNVYSTTGLITGGLSWMNTICDFTTLTTCATVTGSNALKVDGSAVTQPVSNGGTFAVQATLQASATTAIGKVDPNTIATWGLAPVGGTSSSPTNALVGGCQYNSSAPTFTTGDSGAVQCTSAGSVHTTVDNALASVSDASSGVATSTFGSPVVNHGYTYNGSTWDQMRSFSGATAAAPPSGAVYLGANASGATGGKLAGMITCDSHVFKHITTATDTLAVQGVASQTIYVCGMLANGAGTATAFLENTASANANCSSSNTQIAGQVTAGTASASGFYNPLWGGLKNTSGNGLCINSTGTGGVDVDVWYTQF